MSDDDSIEYIKINGSDEDDYYVNNGGQIIQYYAQDGNDEIYNWVEYSEIYGQYGDDWLVNYANNSVLNGFFGDDTLYNFSDYSHIDGSYDDDIIYNNTYSDAVGAVNTSYGSYSTILGGFGKDQIYNYLNAGVVIKSGHQNDVILNQFGDYATIDGGVNNDTITNISSDYVYIDGGKNNDTIIVEDSYHTEVHGGSYNDSITIIGGDDHIVSGGSGDDIIQGGDGQEAMHYYYADNKIYSDVYNAAGGIDTLHLHINYDDLLWLTAVTGEPSADNYLANINNAFNASNELDFNDYGIFLSISDFEHLTIHIPDLPTSTLTVADAEVKEGSNGNDRFMVFTVNLNQPLETNEVITVDYATVDGTAGSGVDADYASVQGTLSFNPGVTSQEIQVQVFGDNVAEITETMQLHLSNAAGADIVDVSVSGTITDNDVKYIEGTDGGDVYNNDDGIAVQYVGGNGGDVIATNGERSIVLGQDGDDSITISADNVTAKGGKDNDLIQNYGANNFLYGNGGDDGIINSGGEATTVLAGNGDDHITNENADDVFLYGSSGIDTIINSNSNDIFIQAGVGDDIILNQNSLNSILKGGGNNDTITNKHSLGAVIVGGANNDTITNEASSEVTIDAGSGADSIVSSQSDHVSIEAGTGSDSVHIVDSNFVQMNGGEGGDDIVIENSHYVIANGGDNGDAITVVGGDANELTGGDGYDVLTGGDGRENMHYYYADNVDNSDLYDGQGGEDTVSFHISYQNLQDLSFDYNAESVSNYLDALQQKFSANDAPWFGSYGFNLKANNFENFDVHVFDMPVELSVSDAVVTEGDHGVSQFLEFAVDLAMPLEGVSHGGVSVDYTTAGLSAGSLLNGDFVLSQGTLVFDPGETQKIIQVEVLGDNRIEDTETISLHLSHAVGADIVQADAVGIILDEDMDSSPLAVPIFNSNIASDHLIYLDFDGAIVTDTAWNQTHDIDVINAAPYDLDDDYTSFNAAEVQKIEAIVARVAEDYAPFNVNVTTDAELYQQTASDNRVWSVITDTRWEGFSGHGGAFRNVVGDEYHQPSWVISKNYAAQEWIMAETISHEVGHTLGLAHDGQPNDEYYDGHGNWFPIMASFVNNLYKGLSQWSSGEYIFANNQQDDVGLLADRYGFRQDDHGDGFSEASLLHLGEGISAEGLIEQRTDVDVFADTAVNGVSYAIKGIGKGTNLDILANLYSAEGELLASSDPADSLDAVLQYQFDEATDVYITVEGVGQGNPLTDGYSDYGSLGYYSIEVTREAGDTEPLQIIDAV